MENIYTNDVPIQINHDYYRSESAKKATANSIDVLNEIYTTRHYFPQASSKLEDAYPVPIETDHSHYSLNFTNSTIEEKNADGIIEISHNHYRFAYDLVETVLQIRGDLNPNMSHNLPEPQKYLFTEEHRNIVTTLLKTDTQMFLRGIHHISNDIFDYGNYLTCRDFFVEQWKNRVYTEKSFISACATVAYVAAYFIQMNYYCGALDDVVEFISFWIEKIFEHGTIDNSSW